MTYLSEGCMSGHYWHGGSVCSLCGERLRCGCGRFVREDALDAHVRECKVLEAQAIENETRDRDWTYV